MFVSREEQVGLWKFQRRNRNLKISPMLLKKRKFDRPNLHFFEFHVAFQVVRLLLIPIKKCWWFYDGSENPRIELTPCGDLVVSYHSTTSPWIIYYVHNIYKWRMKPVDLLCSNGWTFFSKILTPWNVRAFNADLSHRIPIRKKSPTKTKSKLFHQLYRNCSSYLEMGNPKMMGR